MSTALVVAITILSPIGALVCVGLLLGAINDHKHQGQHDVGPDSLQLLEDLDAHLDEYVAADPELAAGFGRLRDALREHREEKDQ